MPQIKNYIAIAIIGLIGFGIYKALKPKDNDYSYLLNLPSHFAELAEKKQTGAIRRFISKDYLDSQNRSQQDVHSMITAFMLIKEEISVSVSNEFVEIDSRQEKPHATLSFDAVFNRSESYTFKLQLEKSDDGWLVDSAVWSEK